VLGVGVDVDDVGPHAGATAVDHAGHERHRDAGRRERHDGVGAQHAVGWDVDRAELGAAAARAGVATVEEVGAAVRALVGDEVGRAVVEHEVVDDRDLGRHGRPPGR
jgi:hypothetical protein